MRQVENVRLFALVPKKGAKEETHDDCGQESHTIVGGIPPVGPEMFPEARRKLSNEGPGIWLIKEEIL